MRTKFIDKSGIYCIRCVVNGRKYVGQARDINKRLHSHISSLKRGVHYSKDLQADWIKYGEDAFEFYVLCQCERKFLNQNETFWINRFSPEYNRFKNPEFFASRETDNDRITNALIGLEDSYQYKEWHRWVYGSGRHSVR